jgi:kexin
MQFLLIRTATKNNPGDAGWVTTGSGLSFNHKYGFGRINAGAAVDALATWNYLPARATELIASEATAVSIPDNNVAGITRSRTISGAANFRSEHVEVVVNATHPKRSDLRFQLTSPYGTIATLHEPNNYTGANLNN